jgi:hypothetical protein
MQDLTYTMSMIRIEPTSSKKRKIDITDENTVERVHNWEFTFNSFSVDVNQLLDHPPTSVSYLGYFFNKDGHIQGFVRNASRVSMEEMHDFLKIAHWRPVYSELGENGVYSTQKLMCCLQEIQMSYDGFPIRQMDTYRMGKLGQSEENEIYQKIHVEARRDLKTRLLVAKVAQFQLETQLVAAKQVLMNLEKELLIQPSTDGDGYDTEVYDTEVEK